MRTRNLLILTLLVAALGAFVWFVERDLPTTEEREERAKRVLDLESEDVTAVELAWEDQRVVLERQTGGDEGETGEDEGAVPTGGPSEWRLVEPLEARAKSSAVDSLLRRLTELEKERTLEGEDPSAHGLDSPELTVTLITGEGETTLEVGDELALEGRRIVSTGGGEVLHVVSGGFVSMATKDPGEWRNPSLFPGSRTEIERVRLEGEGEPVLLARRDQRFWVESPYADAADSRTVDSLLGEITGLEATEFLDDPGRIEDLTTDRGRIEVVLEGREAPFVVALGGPAPTGTGGSPVPGETEGSPETEADESARVARVDDQWVVIETDLAGALRRPPGEWRSKEVTARSSWEIGSLRIRSGGEETVLTREDGDWIRGEERISYSDVSGLLTTLTGLRGEEVRPDGVPPEADPDLEFELFDEEGVGETIRLWESEEGVLVGPPGRDVLLVAGEEDLQALESAIATVREAEPVQEEVGPTGDAGDGDDGAGPSSEDGQ
ncbi:MAG: DUF4340 domain-containing protein [Thermoanaerobaculia bacterium]|nr:DUF4340 domain-containing protein [Thermoanaerobaculia bacterium]